MTDRLKQYVDNNREEFEMHQPREHLWKEVDHRLQHGRKGMVWRMIAIAASVLLIVTCGTWIYFAGREDATVVKTTTVSHPQIKEAETYYTSIVQRKGAELEQYCGPQPELCKEFQNDMQMLNHAYEQLKKEYANSADKEMILQAMKSNLKMQVELISKQLQIMETVEQKKDPIISI